ncbi:MAG: hypothetical protein J6Q94_09880 [Clostridia bacterium]|nr:hypothetical protein [Clostridia bacterium]
MGLIKFITVFDDEKQMILSEKILKRYNISAYPSVFFCENKPYFNGLNADSDLYAELKSQHNVTRPGIPAKIFQREFTKSYHEGYFAVVVICPHRKWFPYYDEAITAMNRIKRSKKYDFRLFRMSVIDSKSFGAGVMMHALQMAHDYEVDHNPSGLVIEYGKINAMKNKSYIFSQTPTAFCDKSGCISAFEVSAYQVKPIDVDAVFESISYDLFADRICQLLKKSKGNYVVSVGSKCDFAGNIIGRIIKKSGIKPFCVMQYSVTTAAVLGTGSICVNIY